MPDYRRGYCDGRLPTVNPDILKSLDAIGAIIYTSGQRYGTSSVNPTVEAVFQNCVTDDGILITKYHYNDLFGSRSVFRKQVQDK